MRGICHTAVRTALGSATLGTIGAVLWLATWAPVRAETIVVNDQVEVVKSTVPRPTGGMTMEAVEKRFGVPRERHPSVGTPPITRWDYDQFAVFFEKDRVIDAVVTAPPAPAEQPVTPANAVSTPSATSASAAG